ncbi:HNH endonuclease signature motif containing protein [Lysobacter sp. OAE881]|uniref:HNH endonuclease signature motif containing protein n=1 Tax=Lysobacter sp. OAE881 TaxID=2663813 RepID=UPI00178C055D
MYRNGYGQFWNGHRPEQAHRVSYRLHVGPIPVGLEIDHKCSTRSCINPTHLRAVTHRQNIARSDAVMGVNARKTHCKRGHSLSGENLYIHPTGSRQCRACLRMHARNYRVKK